jgi:hypothetical protein
LYLRLRARGYTAKLLSSIINTTYRSIDEGKHNSTHTSTKRDIRNSVILHLDYHPGNPKPKEIQLLFEEELNHPRNLPTLSDLRNHKDEKINITNMLIAYHRPPNIGNLLSPRIITAEHGSVVSSFMD